MNSINSCNPGQDLDHQASDYLPQQTHHHPQLPNLQTPSQPQPQPRRPRGFAVTAAMGATTATAASNNSNSAGTVTSGGKGKKEREKEKERTKLRERHRRSITSRMLAGLRQYGNFPLPARADMNDVLAALAREAGWVVEADGTTYRQSPPPPQMTTYGVKSVESPLSAGSLRNCYVKATLDCQPSVLRIDVSLSSASLDSDVIAERDTKSEKCNAGSPVTSVECLVTDQLTQGIQSADHGSYFTSTPYVHVYIKLRPAIINKYCQLMDPDSVRQEISNMKSFNVDGIVVDCWWGIIEAWSPQKYLWSGYRELFHIIREFKLKLQVVMAFHEFRENDSSETLISLPQWVLEIGQGNPDIFFTDRKGQRNTECLSWGIDKERVLKGRTGIEVYFDFMRSFRMEFDDMFAEGLISGVEIGLGAAGELKYPSFSERMGWRYPGIGEFQCYDKFMQQSLRTAATLRGHSFWARGPDNGGHYNSMPHETGFFCQRGDYDSYYGRFFLNWYSQTLIDHANNVLSLATLSFEETNVIVKVPAVYLWYKTSSHAAELTAGFYNSRNQDGYAPLFEVLKKHSVTMKFMCLGWPISDQGSNESMSDSEGLTWQVLNSAWDRGLGVAGENALSCCDCEGYKRLIEIAKPRNAPDHRHFTFFVHQQLSLVQGNICFTELDSFVKCMHGEVAGDMGPR